MTTVEKGKTRIQLYQEAQERLARECRAEIFGETAAPDRPDITVNNSMMPYPLDPFDNKIMTFFSPEAKIEETNGGAIATLQGEKIVIARKEVMEVFLKPETTRFEMPPGRNGGNVSGQEKLMVDVAIMIPHVKKTDVVVVTGSYSKNRGGKAYYLLVGNVKSIDLYDPYEKPQAYEEMGTTVTHHAREWDLNEPIKADVFLNDASIETKKGHETVQFKMARDEKGRLLTRVYSLKRFGEEYVCYYDQSSVYHQIRYMSSGEWREVYPKRTPGRYAARLGTCKMCRELDYFSAEEHSASFLLRWSAMHEHECTMRTAARPQDVGYYSRDLGICTVKAVYVRRDIQIRFKFEKKQKESGQLEDRMKAQGMVTADRKFAVMSHYVDFDITDPISGDTYSTESEKGSREVSVSKEMPRESVPHSFIFINDVLIIGPRVFTVEFKKTESAANLVLKRKETAKKLEQTGIGVSKKLKKKIDKPVFPLIYGSEEMPDFDTITLRHPTERSAITREPGTLMTALYRMANFKYAF